MFEDLDMPAIAIAGGFLSMFLLACVLMLGRRRHVDRSAPESRRTSFHVAVIDPAIAECGRAAWERPPACEAHEVHEVDDDMVEIVLPAPGEHTTIGPAPVPPPNRQRLARGSTPGIPPQYQVQLPNARLPARPADWDVPATPSVTARMRATRRS